MEPGFDVDDIKADAERAAVLATDSKSSRQQDNKIAYRDRKNKSKEKLPKAPVPRAICDFLKNQSFREPLLKYAFNFVGYLLATTSQKRRTFAVPEGDRMALAGITNTSILAEWTKELQDKRIIAAHEVSWDFGWAVTVAIRWNVSICRYRNK